MENLKEEVIKLIQEMEEMIEQNVAKEEIERKRKKLDGLLEQYLKDL